MSQETKLVKTLKGANSVAFSVEGMASVGIQISGTFVATLQLEGTIDGTNWFSLGMVNLATGAIATSSTSTGAFIGSCASLKQVRVRASSYTSGLVHITFQSSLVGSIAYGQPTEAHLGNVGGTTNKVTATFAKGSGTTGYDANDAVLPAAGKLVELANAVRIAGGSGYITRIRISTNKKSITPRFRIHFFNASNPTISADNANWQEKYADASKRICAYDMPAMTTAADTTNSDMSRSEDSSMRIPFSAATGATSIYFALEALDAFTPSDGQSFTVMLYTDLN